MIITTGRQIGADEQQVTATTAFDNHIRAVASGQTAGGGDSSSNDDGGNAIPPR